MEGTIRYLSGKVFAHLFVHRWHCSIMHHSFIDLTGCTFLIRVLQSAGRNANKEERAAAKAAADKFITDKNYSSKTQVTAAITCCQNLVPARPSCS